jgi:hypothetical protein
MPKAIIIAMTNQSSLFCFEKESGEERALKEK